MKNAPSLPTPRIVEIFKEMVGVRRKFCADHNFVKMPAVWEDLMDEQGNWAIRRYRSQAGEDYLRRAAVMQIGENMRLTVDNQLWENALRGKKLDNHVLAHELAHVALGHPSRGGVATNFALDDNGRVIRLSPPTKTELEADLGAVFFQCGVALMDDRRDAKELAYLACSELAYVAKAMQYVRLETFQRELKRKKSQPETVKSPASFEQEYWNDPNDWNRLMLLFSLSRGQISLLVDQIWRRKM
jgi:hypothetical protein